MIKIKETVVKVNTFLTVYSTNAGLLWKGTNAWLDAFKAILIRFETNKIHWKALNILAFCVILLRQL
ncbi:MAG: hypothetical protein R2764_10015 [Bacteroidales bacterium]